ncbi:MAG: dicarboxylate/amino acid:cation symporter [Bacteroidetes bacterium]|nr:dicarboxylate/amino acid:cation symporter [Bacteroidota bacterium]MCB9227699.1 dicarboxylate/amino acid:cation symporter [Chitinophagales bacterium]
MKKLALHWKIIIGMILGIIWAVASTQFGLSLFTINWIAPFGKIFINVLKLIAIPLVLFSVMSGIISIGTPQNLGKIGVKTLGFYLFSTVIAVSVGLILVNLLSPGKILEQDTRLENRLKYEIWAQSNQIPIKDGQCFSCKSENTELLEIAKTALANEEVSQEVLDKINTANKTLNSGPLQALVDVVPTNIFEALIENSMLQIIFFALFFGLAVLYIPKDKRETLENFINATNEVFLKMIDFIMMATPFFVFALMAGILTEMAGDDLGKMLDIFKGLGFYAIVVVLGLAFMVFIFYPILLKLLVKGFKYIPFFRKIAPAQMLAFTTSSSAATLPVTIEVVEENLKVDKNISGFVLPIGATVNMDGTSLYQAVAAIFLAQIHLIDLSLGQQLTIVVTATLASIGSAAVPSAGLVMLMIVLSSVGLNPAWIAIILPVDRILDMCRTMVNVTGDTTVASIINGEIDNE